ncbi:hypothetical protein PuT2_07880 [Pusillimonas sp. T2]|uniref:flagellar hook-length control protein FliK n=1 Tax=Pusillimonas sp. T2 TaxID=1548123 RepID=UPI000B946465|nr:flagellar hook-length control protein FliK [Pusillimonas sp. T2]OXR49685.1 hypothetical protein PuT2_07880 [Pusillimonas sp. T2]
MNAQNPASVLNMISAPPAVASQSSPDANANGPRFSEVLGSQKAAQAPAKKPAQSNDNASAQKNAAAQGSQSNNGAISTQDSNSQSTDGTDGAQSSKPDGAQTNQDALATADDAAQAAPAPGTETAAAMSSLALAVAQVQLAARSAQVDADSVKAARSASAVDADSITLASQSQRTPALTEEGLPGNTARLNDANLVSAAAARQSEAREATQRFSLTNVGTDTADSIERNSADTILRSQSARETNANKAGAAITLADVGQRADHLDKQARLNASARDVLANKIAQSQGTAETTTATRVAVAEFNTNAADTRSIEPLALSSTPQTGAMAAPGQLTASGAPASGASLVVATPLGHPQWGNNFSQQVSQVSQSLKNGLQSIELRLDPPDLGPIRISININDGVAQAMFVSPHAAVRSAVENALPQLQQQMAQAGISLGQTSVSDQGQGQQQAENGNNSGRAGLSGTALSSGATLDQPDTALASRPQSTHNGQVDTFA